jgi:hypothetical protein
MSVKANGRSLPEASPHVFGVRHRLQVGGIAAPNDAAEMVEFETFWDRPDENLVSNS